MANLLPHDERSIREALSLRHECVSIIWGDCHCDHVTDVRTLGGVLQVRLRARGLWFDLTEAHSLWYTGTPRHFERTTNG